ncbi:MAG: hypothetical protein K8R23_05610 [Chthoniobacter sp.]|nr:hypothetical protein [Chthoniobacter sp.]
MNTNDAEMLLRCHREGREPDSRLQKALRLAEGDAAVGKRLRAQTEFDAQIIEAIRSIVPPENLRAQVVPRMDAVGGGVPKLRSHLHTPALLAALAGVLLFVGVVVFLIMENMAEFPGREAVEGMLETTNRMTGAEMEPMKTTTAKLGDWLMLHGYEGYEAPPELAAEPVVAARVFARDGKRIAQYAVEQHESVVFEFHATDFGVQLPADSGWTIIQKNARVAALRPSGEHCVMISFRGSKAEMRAFLKTLPKR